jgi:hypothetical protein
VRGSSAMGTTRGSSSVSTPLIMVYKGDRQVLITVMRFDLTTVDHWSSG